MEDDFEKTFELLYRFEKLNNSNWKYWSVYMKAALRVGRLWEVVVAEDTDKLKAELATDEALQHKDHAAVLSILLIVADQVFPLVARAETAHEAWANLAAMFQPHDLWHRGQLQRQLYSIKQHPYESDIAYIARAADLRNQLAAAGCSAGHMEGFTTAAIEGLRENAPTERGQRQALR